MKVGNMAEVRVWGERRGLGEGVGVGREVEGWERGVGEPVKLLMAQSCLGYTLCPMQACPFPAHLIQL